MSNDREKFKKAIIVTAISIGKRLLSNYEFDSDLSSDSETEILLTLCSEKKKNKVRRIQGYVEQTVHHFTNKQFQSNFRITRETFQSLLITIGPKMKNTTGTGRPMVPVEKQLLATIWLLATPDSYRYADICLFVHNICSADFHWKSIFLHSKSKQLLFN